MFKNASHTIEVNQRGNNQNLTLFGGNSISEKLKVSMQGQNQTIIVRNLNPKQYTILVFQTIIKLIPLN